MSLTLFHGPYWQHLTLGHEWRAAHGDHHVLEELVARELVGGVVAAAVWELVDVVAVEQLELVERVFVVDVPELVGIELAVLAVNEQCK